MVTQTEFEAALLDAERPVPEGLVDGQGAPAGRRYAVYRNNVAVSLSEALETAFPAVAKLIGPENFAKAAGMYLRREQPRSPLMMFYGAGFPEFLASLEPLKPIGYLSDVARVEMALRESYHAADASVLDPAVFQGLEEEDLMASRLGIAPSVRIIRSPWPVLSVYNFTMIEGSPQPQPTAEDVLVARPDYDPTPYLLPKGGADFVQALQQDQSFGDALGAAGDDFDLGATLALLLQGGALTDLKRP
ncbi:putative DNA-binding domain-containing protein [Tropicibacter sp. R15_0]|uniref:HvfC/BufC N-terminal domain-containing protein n=1 Tax=Tropicibacter sp. R15_0 TaxID=2821101 RepID=UPI001ADBC011|nr:DNA-binding domain-containing protein [Tropicibacter sp. R15_0]MBO9467484.1 putative DNA-binding domain-containing protein [Tropicibacter sp. R15_0]